MKFDVVIGNPPFNTSAGGSAGTGGNSRVYRQFRFKSLKLLKKDGYLLFVTPKNIFLDLQKSIYNVVFVNLMDSISYWSYNTLYFMEQNSIKLNSEIPTEGGICSKLFKPRDWKYREFNRTEDRINTGSQKAVIQVPKQNNDFKVEYAFVKTCLPAAPRFAFSLLESKKSYIVTSLPFCASMSGCVETKTEEDAYKLKLFIEKSKLVTYFVKTFNLKGRAKDTLRFMKAFDLSQIKTGYEYPVEFNLSQEEIDYIESNLN